MILEQVKSVLRPLKRILVKEPDHFLDEVTGVIHVGANTGQERGRYDGYKLDVLWIEPIHSVFAELRGNIEGYRRQRAVQALVTDTDGGTYDFNIASNNGQSSSILALGQHKDAWPDVVYTDTVQLTSTTLPTLLKTHDLDADRYQALVMDTQGSELLVLQGSLPILAGFKYIKTEVADCEAYEGCCQLSDVCEFMAEHGFEEYERSVFATSEAGSYYDVTFRRVDRRLK